MIYSSLKKFLGIVLIALAMVIKQTYPQENFVLQILITMPVWVAIFIFFDWREWTN